MGREEKEKGKGGTGDGRGGRSGKRRRGEKGKKWMELQPPGNCGLSEPPETDRRYLPEIHSLLLPNIVHDSNDLQCQHILTKVWTKTNARSNQ